MEDVVLGHSAHRGMDNYGDSATNVIVIAKTVHVMLCYGQNEHFQKNRKTL